MKSLPVARRGTGPARLRQDGVRTAPPPADVLRPRGDPPPAKSWRTAPRKRSKGLFARLIEEAFDAIEDVFD
jgi:hypothetical protein